MFINKEILVLYLSCSKFFIFMHFFRVRQFLGICYVAKTSKQGLLKNTKKSLNQ
jgi:hypothetical protein